MIKILTEISSGNLPQWQMFKAIAPIIERAFSKADSAWFNAYNAVVFDCGYDVKTESKILRFPPNEEILDALVTELNEFAAKKNSIIKFQAWAEDCGGAIPAGIVAYFEEDDFERKIHIETDNQFECVSEEELPWNK